MKYNVEFAAKHGLKEAIVSSYIYDKAGGMRPVTLHQADVISSTGLTRYQVREALHTLAHKNMIALNWKDNGHRVMDVTVLVEIPDTQF